MNRISCADCGDKNQQIHGLLRKAEKARSKSLPVADMVAEIHRLQQWQLECEHLSNDMSKAASRARHAVNRETNA